jgi:hypothetical protein
MRTSGNTPEEKFTRKPIPPIETHADVVGGELL